MLEFSLPLVRNQTRPTIRLYQVQAVIDTGSSIPIIDMDSCAIEKIFGGQKLSVQRNVNGIGSSIGELYRLSEFRFGDMVFHNIIALQAKIMDANADILLGSCMYGGGTKCVIDTENDSVSFMYPDNVVLSHSLWNKDKFGIWRQLDFQDGKFIHF